MKLVIGKVQHTLTLYGAELTESFFLFGTKLFDMLGGCTLGCDAWCVGLALGLLFSGLEFTQRISFPLGHLARRWLRSVTFGPRVIGCLSFHAGGAGLGCGSLCFGLALGCNPALLL
jgi:hypothetical protein